MTIYSLAYPAFPVRPDLVGTPWWRALMDEVVPRYAELIRGFEKNTQIVMSGSTASSVTYKLGNTSYTYHRRLAKSETVLTLIEGVCTLQSILDKADRSVGHGVNPHCLVIDLSAVTVQGDLTLPSADLPQLLCYHTVFEGDADFSEPDFRASACFDGADFMGNAIFRNVTFRQPSSFRRTVFRKNAGFFCAFGPAIFESAVFAGFADFEGAIIRGDEIEFENCIFLGETDFDG
jgi:hypothetical protein